MVEKPSPPASIDSWSSRTICVELLGRGLAADRVLAHDVAAERAVPDEEAGVDADVALERVEVLAEASPSSTATPCSSAASGMPSTFAIMRRM